MRQVPDSPAARRWSVVGVAGIVLLVLTAATAVGVVWHGLEQPDDWASAGQASAAHAEPARSARPPRAAAQPPAPPNPAVPTGNFQYAGDGPLLGGGGRLVELRVAAEDGSGVDVADFAALVDETLGDPRSWIAGGDVRYQRVAGGAPADLTIYLATPTTAERLCVAGGISTVIDGVPYTSCRVGRNVVINLDRYQLAVPNYGAPLTVYRQYVINHEVGHFLGHNHEGCPAPGQPAPVMQQQTLSLDGCVANSWPYLDGKRYAGPPGGQ